MRSFEFGTAVEELACLGYKYDARLGEGTYGTVIRAFNMQTNKLVAIKVISKSLIKRGEVRRVQLELQAMKNLDHPNIIKLVDLKETLMFIFMIIEYCSGGDLLKHVQAKERVSEEEALALFRQLVSAIETAHNHGFIHRDIKLENLMLTQDGSLKVGDWGFARKWEPGSLIREFPGSLHYASPEIVLAKPYKGPEVDVWSMGVTLYALASGCMPFFGANDEIIVQRIKTSTFPMYHTFSRNLKDLVEHLLEKDPEKRFTLQQLKEHPWFSCKVELHGMTRVRSRSVVYHQGTGHGTHVPFLHLEECNKLKADEKIIVTPKGIISHREYVEQNNPPTEETNGTDPNSPPMVGISPSPSPDMEESGGSSMTSAENNTKDHNKDRDREAKDKMDTRDKDKDALKKKTKWTSLLRLIGKNNNSSSPTKKDEHAHTGTGKPKITTPPALLVNQEMFASPYI